MVYINQKIRCLLFLYFFVLFNSTFSQTVDNNQWVWDAIHVPNDSRTAFHPKKKITVAVIDDGFDLNNPLWKNCLANNAKEIAGNNIDDDNNGKIDDARGWDFADNDNDVMPHPKSIDKLSHGTAVLGILCQALDKLLNERNKYVSILPLKAKSDFSNNNYITEGYKAIEYAIQQHADVIVCCWSGGQFTDAQKQVLRKAFDKNICIVASAGNFAALKEEYPGAYSTVINVTGITHQLQKQSFSNYGSFVDIAAPSDSIATYVPGDTTISVKMNGTSASTPIVAAAVVAMKASAANLTVFDIDRLLKQRAVALEPYNTHYKGQLGAGLVNIETLLALMQPSSQVTTLYQQPKCFIPFDALSKKIYVQPDGVYKSLNFYAMSAKNIQPGKQPLPAVDFRYYLNNKVFDTVVKGNALFYPLALVADSVVLTAKNKNLHFLSGYYLYYEAVTVDSSCLFCKDIKNIHASFGDIEDGSGTENYTGRNDCKWLIEVPQGKRIKITFDAFDTEAKTDFVYLFNGTTTNAPILAMFSGPAIPPYVISWSNQVLIWFVTDEFNNYKGWKLHFEAVE